MNAPVKISFEMEARELAEDEHFELCRQIERSDPCVGRNIREDHNVGATPEEHFQNHRDHFLERAREEFSECVA